MAIGKSRAIRAVASCVSGAGVSAALFFGLGSAPLMLGGEALAGSAAGLITWYLWPVLARDTRASEELEQVELESIGERLPEMVPLGLKISEPELRARVWGIHTLGEKILKYLKENPDTSPPEAPILLMKNVNSTINTVKRYLALPKRYEETTANLDRTLESANSALDAVYDSLCRNDADAFARACEVVEKTLKALNTLLPIGRTGRGSQP